MFALRRKLGRVPVACCLYLQKRSYKATYEVFPTTLHTLKHRAGLFFPQRDGGTGHDGSHMFDVGITVAKDGYVYPKDTSQMDDPIKHAISEDIISNGLVMLPNTNMMQAIIAEKVCDSMPTVFMPKTFPKVYSMREGTPIPEPLVLVHVYQSLFSLQPEVRMLFRDFNQALVKLFEEYSLKLGLEDWQEEYPVEDSVEDGDYNL
ncbi:hypothetical protein CDD82_3415 [Ophiocordyceps australis]|uniref:Tse2 ADP-ribosyltransferase toxin domain-containing protein n=1 Tax=Ophiocordyceps australis TaxID=1399860 RepID=A0A2C5ZD43_9HYPO|nr:hypothetical protein CDD82_3415 [Ophiocordyceps australis]